MAHFALHELWEGLGSFPLRLFQLNCEPQPQYVKTLPVTSHLLHVPSTIDTLFINSVDVNKNSRGIS